MGLLDNRELLIQITEHNVKKLNEIRHMKNPDIPLYTEEQVKAEALKIADDQTRHANYLMANALLEKKEKCRNYCEGLLDEIRRTQPDFALDAGLNRLAYFMLKEEKTPADREYNKQFLIKCGNPAFAAKALNQVVNECYHDNVESSYQTSIKDYLIDAYGNFNKYQKRFVLCSSIENSSCLHNKYMSDLKTNNMKLIEGAAEGIRFAQVVSSDVYLTIPSDITNEECVLMMMETSKYMAEVTKSFGGNKTEYFSKNSSSLALMNSVTSSVKTSTAIKEYLKKGLLPKNYHRDYTFKENGRPIKVNEALEKLANGENITWEKKPADVIKNQDELASRTMIDGAKIIHDKCTELEAIYKELKSSGHFYSIKTTEYVNLKTALEGIVKTPKFMTMTKISNSNVTEFETALKTVTDAAAAYKAKKLEENHIDSIRQHRINICDRLTTDFNTAKVDNEFYVADARSVYLHNEVLNNHKNEDVRQPVEVNIPENNDVRENILNDEPAVGNPVKENNEKLEQDPLMKASQEV